MSESLKIRWILKYFSEIAQTHGANLLSVPESVNKRRVQIVQFLTYPRDDNPDDVIWARVSDKDFSVPVRFTSKAVSEYNCAKNIYTDATLRLTSRRHAIATIGQFKPFFARVPLPNGRGIDVVERLALEVNLVSVAGADHEGLFGDPRDLEADEDMRAWCEGLRAGGGEGNVLKVAKEVERRVIERARSRTEATIGFPNNAILRKEPPADEPSPYTHPRHVNEEPAKILHPDEDKLRLTKPEKKLEQKDILKEWRKSWKVAEYIWPCLVDIPEEVKIEHTQILKFGKDSKSTRSGSLQDISVLEGSIDELEKREQQRSKEAEEKAVQKGLPVREQASTASNSLSDSHPGKGHLPSPKSTPAKGDSVQLSNASPSTPSVWPSSDEEDEGAVEQEVSPAERNEERNSENAEQNVEQSSPSLEVGQRISENIIEHSSLREPTPAQRPVQNTSKPIFPFHDGAKRSGSRTQSTQSDSAIVNDTSTSFDISQSRFGIGQLATSTMFRQPLPDMRREAMERNREMPPRVLVPDSDASGGASQPGHSQSQSQSQPLSQSQAGSFRNSSLPLLPSQAHNIGVVDPVQKGNPVENQFPSWKAASNNSQSRHPLSIDSAAKENQLGGGHKLARSQSTSQTQTDSQHSADDPFLDHQNSKLIDKQRRKGSPEPIQLMLTDSRGNQTHEDALEDGDNGAEISQDMDVDDARTHSMLLSSANHRIGRDEESPGAAPTKPSSKDKQFTIKGLARSPRPKSEQRNASVLLSPDSSPQSSPSAHLGKRPRSSSIIIQSSSPNVKAKGESSSSPHAKGAREALLEDAYAVQRVEHEPEAWKSASFIRSAANTRPVLDRQRAKEVPGPVVKSRASSSSRTHTKSQGPGNSSAVGLEAAPTEVRPRAIESSTSVSRSNASRQNSTGPGPRMGSPGATVGSSRELSKKASKTESFAQRPSRKLPRIEATPSMAPVTGSCLLFSNNRYIVDFNMRRDPGGPEWINWNIEETLLKIGRLRYKESLMSRKK